MRTFVQHAGIFWALNWSDYEYVVDPNPRTSSRPTGSHPSSSDPVVVPCSPLRLVGSHSRSDCGGDVITCHWPTRVLARRSTLDRRRCRCDRCGGRPSHCRSHHHELPPWTMDPVLVFSCQLRDRGFGRTRPASISGRGSCPGCISRGSVVVFCGIVGREVPTKHNLVNVTIQRSRISAKYFTASI